MAGAGLTVGAFYAHFRDKDDLLDQAFAEAMTALDELLLAPAHGRVGPDALVEVSAHYLSTVHRDRPEGGCPLPAIASGAAVSESPGLRKLSAGGLAHLVDRVVELSGVTLHRDRALAIAILMVGGQLLARATQGAPLSSQILRAARQAAAELLRPHSPTERTNP